MVAQDRSWNWDAESIWQKNCGFLDLGLEEFNEIQEALLLDSLLAIHNSPLGQRLLKGTLPTSVNEFREKVPLTGQDNYLPDLSHGNNAALSQPAYHWVPASTAAAGGMQVPYTLRAYEVVTDNLMSAFVLSCAGSRGEVNINLDERVLFATPPRPFLSGLLAFDMADRFGFQSILNPLEAEGMEFAERIEKEFARGLATGVNILVSMSAILLKTGEEIARRQDQGSLSSTMLHPMALARLGLAYSLSKLHRRDVLPRDLWRPKAILSWGIVPPSVRQQVEYYWGKTPYQFYCRPEGGVMALQGWNKKGMTLVPYSSFYEFIPEEEAMKSREDADYRPSTCLIGGLEAGQKYELVITSFYGMPLLRYRVGQLLKVVGLEDQETGVKLPQIEVENRHDEEVDPMDYVSTDGQRFREDLAPAGSEAAEQPADKELAGEKPVLGSSRSFPGGLDRERMSSKAATNGDVTRSLRLSGREALPNCRVGERAPNGQSPIAGVGGL